MGIRIDEKQAIIEKAISARIIRDKSYETVRYGMVQDYSGSGIVEHKGKQYRVVDHGPEGNESVITKRGYVAMEEL